MIRLYEHQKRALEMTKDFNRCAYYIDMGGGKTFIGSEKMMQLDARVNLVICQKSKIRDWTEHFDLYLDSYHNHNMVYDLSDWNGLEAFLDVIADHGYTQRIIGVINYDLVWRRKDLLKLHDFTLLLDESSLIQNHTAKRTKFILGMDPANVILLSGTPTSGRYERLWTQLHLLGWPISRKLYEQTYVVWDYLERPYTTYRIPVVKGYKNVPRLKRKMREYGCIFMKTDEFGIDLPDQQDIRIRVDPSTVYKRFMKDRIVTVDGRELAGDTTLTMLLYARMLCGYSNKEKLNAVEDLIQSTEERLVIFYNFNVELKVLRDLCKDRPVSLVNGTEKDLQAYESQSDSVTLIQYQAGAYGLNLQKCSRAIYFTLPLNSELFEQSKKRIHRIGQSQKCFYYLPVCSGSVEEKILKSLRMRKDYTDALFKEDYG